MLGLGAPPPARALQARPLIKPAYVSTGVRALDSLLGGGVATGSITEFIGEFGAGKTQVCHQLAVMVQLPRGEGGLGARALYIDTEGTFRPERIVQIARHKGLDPEKTLENIIYARAYNSDHLASLLRSSAELVIGGNVSLVAVDEVSALPRREEDREARVHAFHSVVAGLKVLASLGAAIVATRQVVSVEEALMPAGGAALDSYATRSVFIEKSGPWVRSVSVLDELGLGEHAEIALAEEGVVDV